MFLVFSILIVLASFLLGLVVLIQNPKGGGLSGSFGGVGTQFMGVKQTTDILEKGTWLFAAIVGILCLISPLFLKKQSDNVDKTLNNTTTTSAPAATTAPTATATTTAPVAPDATTPATTPASGVTPVTPPAQNP